MYPKRLSVFLVLASLFTGSLACKFLTNFVPSGESNGDDGSVQVFEGTLPPLAPLNQAALNTDGLASYQIKLNMTASGTADGQPFQWVYDINYMVSADPGMTIFTMDSSGPGKDDQPRSSAYVKTGDQVVSRVSAEDTCAPIDPQFAQAEMMLPGALLPDLSAAQSAGKETLDGVKVDHFTVSDSSSGLAGDVYQMEQGGTVMKAHLTQDGSLKQLGIQSDGHAEWDYTLTVGDRDLTADVPAACRHLLGEVPFPSDVQNLTGRDEVVTFTTHQSLAEVSAFYSEALEKDGWIQVAKPTISDRIAGLYYSHEDATLNVAAQRGGNLTAVAIFFNK